MKEENIIKSKENGMDKLSSESLIVLYERNKQLFQNLTKLNAENLREVELYSEYRVWLQEEG